MLADFTRGLPGWAIDWLLHSNHPLAIENRREIKRREALKTHLAIKRQAKRHEWMKEEAKKIDPKAPMRPLMSIEPEIAQKFREKYGDGCITDKDFIDDCRRTAPELFYPK